MAGGLLNLIAIGNANIILTGNPDKTFFRITYSKYTNFGLQKFRIDYNGTKDLRLTEPSTFTFKIPRYAELLMDTYLVVTIPDIWSPIYPPNSPGEDNDTIGAGIWSTYDFRWIEDLGTHMIKEIEVTCGSFTVAKYSGDYLAAMVDRDFTEEKKNLFNEMTGNTINLNNPGIAHDRFNTYPNAYFQEQTSAGVDNYAPTNLTQGVEPSIRGKQLYIPLNTWFTLNSQCAVPLIAMQYNEMEIKVTLRPIQELFRVRDVHDSPYFPYIQPNFNENRFQMYRFLQSPRRLNILSGDAYANKFNTWNADVHLLSTYAFLSKEEAKIFAKEDQAYLVKDVYTYKYDNIYGSKKLKIESKGMVSSWMWYLQRNDVNLRNEWSNYTNWPYRKLPNNVQLGPVNVLTNDINSASTGGSTNTGIFTSGNFAMDNQKHIMTTMGILLDGKYRENTLPRGVFDYIEKYTRTNGFAKEGLYCYNFCLDTNPKIYQPSGAMNLGKFQSVELEVNTFIPRVDEENSSFNIICDDDGTPIAVNKSNWRLYEYTYNLVLFEERYNVISFIGGNAGLLYAR
jgi:hypothetical protein